LNSMATSTIDFTTHQTYTVTETDRPFLQTGISWAQFEAIEAAFATVPHVRLTYVQGVLEIMGVGKLHEMISSLLGLLLGQYFLLKQIPFLATGTYNQKVEGMTGFQPDLSYCFGEDAAQKEIPDLCIEVVVTSGGLDKLQKYYLRGVPEVWFWVEGNLYLYGLTEAGYGPIDRSHFLPDLDLAHLAHCLSLESHLEAMTTFQQRYQAPTP
ncbi:MAG: Uma2 family endonuclease, partial [Prochlorothrix sp.]